MAFYLGGGRAGQGEIGQLRPELDAAGVGVDVEDDEGLGLCGVCVGFGCGSVEGGGSYPSIHPSMRASEWSVCVDICTDLRRERDGLAVAPELHLLGQVLA